MPCQQTGMTCRGISCKHWISAHYKSYFFWTFQKMREMWCSFRCVMSKLVPTNMSWLLFCYTLSTISTSWHYGMFSHTVSCRTGWVSGVSCCQQTEDPTESAVCWGAQSVSHRSLPIILQTRPRLLWRLVIVFTSIVTRCMSNKNLLIYLKYSISELHSVWVSRSVIDI